MLLRTLNGNDGVARCARYAFGPNRLHLCGPDANRELLAYLKAGVSDFGLARMLQDFKTLYPYLQHIARANHITDPFDDRVVEAYWIGNELLENVREQSFYRHLLDTLRLKNRDGVHAFNLITDKLPHGARMHHSFHVFNLYRRHGHDDFFHTVENMDACRISWGTVAQVAGPNITVNRKPLVLVGHQLELGKAVSHVVTRPLEDDGRFDELKPGQWITMHWHVPCETVTEQDVHWLEHYTQHHLKLANETL